MRILLLWAPCIQTLSRVLLIFTGTSELGSLEIHCSWLLLDYHAQNKTHGIIAVPLLKTVMMMTKVMQIVCTPHMAFSFTTLWIRRALIPAMQGLPGKAL